MTILFEKMHAHGDDFVIVDRRGKEGLIGSELAKRMGDRNRGIGFNQLAVLYDCADAAARVEFFNTDGSTLDTCGSATRGVAQMLLQDLNTSVVLRTNRGLLTCSKTSTGLISVDMGAPVTRWQDIPLRIQADSLSLPLAGTPAACSMGNPHCTFFVDDVDAVPVEMLGKETEANPLFPQKTNVHFVQVMSPGRIRLRIWERGGGVPLGSGSCSCGAVVNGIRRGLLGHDVEVVCDGGSVWVRWDGVGSVFLTGRVDPSFRGVWSRFPTKTDEHHLIAALSTG